MKDKINYKKGYTLLFSIIVASVVLSIAAFILSVSRKQFILASVSRDSTIAIYAADSAIQCAIEAYSKANLATSTLVNGVVTPRSATVNCNNESVSSAYVTANQGENFTLYNLKNDATFRVEKTDPDQPLTFYNSNDSCAFITVIQGYDATNNGHKTIIEARGYSNNYSPPCAPNSPYNPRNVERAIRLIYND
jgi:type II secretory pathway pseudopilin PulG